MPEIWTPTYVTLGSLQSSSRAIHVPDWLPLLRDARKTGPDLTVGGSRGVLPRQRRSREVRVALRWKLDGRHDQDGNLVTGDTNQWTQVNSHLEALQTVTAADSRTTIRLTRASGDAYETTCQIEDGGSPAKDDPNGPPHVWAVVVDLTLPYGRLLAAANLVDESS
jgi:hypothetical protein